MVELGSSWLQPGRCIKVAPSALELIQVQIDIATIVKNVGILGRPSLLIDLDRFFKVLQSLLVFTQMVERQPSVVEVNWDFAITLLDSLIEVFDSIAVVFVFKVAQPTIVECARLLI